MKCITLLLTIILATAVSCQAQTVQKKSLFLKSHVIKKQARLAAKKDSLLAGPLTIEGKLMMMPLVNNLNYKINAPFNTTKINYSLRHKFLFKIINSAVENWYTNKYNIDYFKYEWSRSLQQSLRRPLPVNPGNSTLFRLIQPNRGWIHF
jgi:hypothetical protein